ncbi:hypothetical protein, partial [Pseudomonas sp. Fl4BN1]|uniref:hypothetical protein n=1 Tax=Pseudomonas sp. Fl4BN1 TaxID=2697651 RepID=UPI001C49C10C
MNLFGGRGRLSLFNPGGEEGFEPNAVPGFAGGTFTPQAGLGPQIAMPAPSGVPAGAPRKKGGGFGGFMADFPETAAIAG